MKSFVVIGDNWVRSFSLVLFSHIIEALLISIRGVSVVGQSSFKDRMKS